MRLKVLIAAAGLVAIAGCGKNSGNGDSVTPNGVSTNPTASAECTSSPTAGVCGPSSTPQSSGSAG